MKQTSTTPCVGINLLGLYTATTKIYDKIESTPESKNVSKLSKAQLVIESISNSSALLPEMWFAASIYMCRLFDTHLGTHDADFDYVINKSVSHHDRFVPLKYNEKIFKNNIINDVIRISFDDMFTHVMVNNMLLDDDTFACNHGKKKIPVDYPWLIGTIYAKYNELSDEQKLNVPMVKIWLDMSYGMMYGYEICDMSKVTTQLRLLTESLKNKMNENGMIIMWHNNNIWQYADNEEEYQRICDILKSYGDELPSFKITRIPYLTICSNNMYIESNDIISFSGFIYQTDEMEKREYVDNVTRFKYNTEMINLLYKNR